MHKKTSFVLLLILLLISLRSNYVSEQFFAQTNRPISKLDSYFINDLNFIHELSLPNYADELKLKVLVNNIFDIKYTSYGGYYTYDLPEGQGLRLMKEHIIIHNQE